MSDEQERNEALPADAAHREAREGEGEGEAREGEAREGEAREGEGEAREGDEGKRDEPADLPLLPAGNPLRIVRGGLTLAVGAIVAFVIMAYRHPIPFGVPLGALAILVATVGALDMLGTFDDPEDRIAGRATLSALGGPLAFTLGGLGFTWIFVRLAVDGRLQRLTAGALIPAAFLAAIVGVYRIGEQLTVFGPDADGAKRPLLRRHGFWLLTAATLLYLPVLGSHSLSDPWETHYGEVSREILARNDWISLWWAQDGWFWSKPVLDFWLQALAMATFGVRYAPDQMLSAVREGRVPWPEWAVRFPVFLLTLAAVYLLYKAVAAVFGRRAGLLGGLVLLTMPQWFLVTHQTMTDMPFVAPMAAAMALFLLGAHEGPDEVARVYELDAYGRKFRLSGYHVVMGAVIACALPQVLYLFSRNIEVSTLGIRAHLDAFMAGSPGNCGLPGNEACHPAGPVLRELSPALQALLWSQALVLILYLNWGERRRQRLFFLGAWFFAALSTMAKGPAGFLLPVLCALAYVVVSKRHRDLLRMEVPSGVLILLGVALPWFLAMYARHGQPFTDRLLFHDMFKRAFTHVHDTNEGDDTSFRYYVWQLGYATFPWTGLAPAGLLLFLQRGEEAVEQGDKDKGDQENDACVFLAMWFLFAFALFSLMLTKFHHYILPAVPPVAMLVGVLLDRLLPERGALAGSAQSAPRGPSGLSDYPLGAAAMAGAILVFFVGRDLSASFEGLPNQVRLLNLFTYNYRRPFPASLDFTRALWVFTVLAAVLTGGLVIARARRYVAWALVSLGVAFAAWGLDVYFMKTSPHWGQRETTLAYYQARESAPGPLIAYQMNWKGENFYTGNHVPAFVSSGKKFQDYVGEERRKGQKVFYFVTEHGRTGTLQNELGEAKGFEKLTTPELNNKFVLVRVLFDGPP
jgi:4-amino-4-deoxy-L-arabinose transferase-like glycosyltransferase